MSTLSTKFQFKLPEGSDVFDNDLYLKGNLEIIESKVYSKTEIDAKDVVGSNANGSYVKYANGVLICWYRVKVTNQTMVADYGVLFQGVRNWTFPIAFISTPVVTCSEFKWGTGSSWGTIGSSPTNTEVVLRGIDVAERAAGTECNISAMAIGKWK